MSTLLLPTAELVAKYWLIAAVERLAGGNVATTLPDLPWPNDEFCQVMNVGGTPEQYVPQMQPVVTVNCFAARKNSTKPPWNKAATLAMDVLLATYPIRYAPDPAVMLALPDEYGLARVQKVKAVSDIRKLPSDASQYAVFSLDLEFGWAPDSVVIP